MKLSSLALAVALSCTLSLANAVPITDWRADELLMQAADAKKELALTDNQALLWEQSVRKTRAILRLRKERRDALDTAAREAASDPQAELRTLAGPLQTDAALLHDEDRELRDVWLTMNDALDDRQRRLVLARVKSMLERQPPGPGADARSEVRPERGGGRPEGGGRGQGPGGMSGGGSIGLGMGSRF